MESSTHWMSVKGGLKFPTRLDIRLPGLLIMASPLALCLLEWGEGQQPLYQPEAYHVADRTALGC